MLKRTGTWELIDAPAGANVMGSKWVFHTKRDVAGHIACHKAQLVAQGFSQVPSIDYFDTFVLVAWLALI